MTSLQSGFADNVGRGGSDLKSWRLTVEKYLSAPFLLFPPFFVKSSQLICCLQASRPNDEWPFLLYLATSPLYKDL